MDHGSEFIIGGSFSYNEYLWQDMCVSFNYQ